MPLKIGIIFRTLHTNCGTAVPFYSEILSVRTAGADEHSVIFGNIE